jgi:poly(3-hydroxyoctanoate) depolymerase
MTAPRPSASTNGRFRPDRTEIVSIDGLRLRWSLHGLHGLPDEPRPLVLVGGIGANVEMWGPLRRALGDRPTIAFDAPGCGESTTPAGPVSIGALAGLITSALDTLGIDEVDVLGYSFGGASAQALARREPRRVRRLVLAATSAGWGGWGALKTHPLALAALLTPARYYTPLGQRMGRRMFGEPPEGTYREADAARLERPPSPLGYSYQALSMAMFSSFAWLPQISQTTLVLAGDGDRASPVENSQILTARIPNARIFVIDNAGHQFLLADEPAGVAEVIDSFLDETPGQTARARRGRGHLRPVAE